MAGTATAAGLQATAPMKQRRRSSVAHLASPEEKPPSRKPGRRRMSLTHAPPSEMGREHRPRVPRTSSNSAVPKRKEDKLLQNILSRKRETAAPREQNMEDSFRDLIKHRDGTSFRDVGQEKSSKPSKGKPLSSMDFIEEETPSATFSMFGSEEFDNPFATDKARASKLSLASVQMVPVHERLGASNNNFPNVFANSFRDNDLDPFAETTHKRIDFDATTSTKASKPRKHDEETVTTHSTNKSASTNKSGSSSSSSKSGQTRRKNVHRTKSGSPKQQPQQRRRSSVGMDTSAQKYLDECPRGSLSRNASTTSTVSTSSDPSRASTGSGSSSRSSESSRRRPRSRVPRLQSFQEDDGVVAARQEEEEKQESTKKLQSRRNRRASLGPMGTSISSGMDLFDETPDDVLPVPKPKKTSAAAKSDQRRRRASMTTGAVPQSSKHSKAHSSKPRRGRRASMAAAAPRDPPGEFPQP